MQLKELVGVVITLVVSSTQEITGSTSVCQEYSSCDITDEIANTILHDDGNYRRLLHTLYPINHAIPQFVLFIFFSNGTAIDEKLCSESQPFVGMVFKLNGYKNVFATMWYSSTTNTIVSTVIMSEMGLFIPQAIVGEFFEKSPIITDYSAVCLTIPFLKPKDIYEINESLLPVTLVVSY